MDQSRVAAKGHGGVSVLLHGEPCLIS